MTGDRPLDLVALVADKDIEQVLLGLLGSRQESLGIRLESRLVTVSTRHDPGVLHEAARILRPFVHRANHALAILDHQGCGRESLPAATVERDLTRGLSDAGWSDRAAAIVIDPEVEVWAWSDSPRVATALGWQTQQELRAWLADQGHWRAGDAKPAHPKEAFDQALRKVSTPRSSAIFRELAEHVSLTRCTDQSLGRLTQVLRAWFGR